MGHTAQIPLHEQGGLRRLMALTDSKDDVTLNYAAIGLQFICANPQVCSSVGERVSARDCDMHELTRRATHAHTHRTES